MGISLPRSCAAAASPIIRRRRLLLLSLITVNLQTTILLAAKTLREQLSRFTQTCPQCRRFGSRQ